MRINPELLIGKELNDGWVIDRSHPSYSGATGGEHSLCYVARRREDSEAFVKLLDTLINPAGKPDPLSDLQLRIEVFQYERRLVEKCQDHHMSGIVRAIDFGDLLIDELPNPVYYLILELANSDLRKQTELDQRFDLAFQMRVLHRTATGLKQLHAADIAHQDVKPSNVIVFDDDSTKLADLGHARDKANPRPGEDNIIAGDPAYAPLEQLYGYAPENWAARRYAADLYHLGCLTVFLLTGVSATTSVNGHLKPEHQWSSWTGDDYQEMLPYIRDATDAVIEEAAACVPESFRDRLVQTLEYLLEPDPALRNHPRNRDGSGSLYGLDRFVSLFDILAKKAEHSLKDALVI